METNDIIKNLRTSRELTQTELGNILNCDRYRVTDIERGKTQPNIQDIKKLSQHFNVSADYLLGLAEYPTIDTDIVMVEKYTGLSEQSIKKLHRMKGTDDITEVATVPIKDKVTGEPMFHCWITGEDIQNLNSLIENIDFYELMLMIKEFLRSELKIALYNQKLNTTNSETNQSLYRDTYLELIESKDYSDLTLFKLQRFFLDIVKNISNDYIKNNPQWFERKDKNADD